MVDGSRETITSIFVNENAFDLFERDSFIEEWELLIKTSSIRNSIFQYPSFLRGWFKSKKNQFAPIIVLQYQREVLTGLICLALDIDSLSRPKGKIKLLGAGEYDAEYQTWITSDLYPLAFLKNALIKIFNLYPNSSFLLRFFLDNQIVEDIKSDLNLSKMCIVQEFSRPLINLQHPEFEKILKKRHLKAKINRFEKAGESELEIIESQDRLREVLPKVMELYDFRQGALFNKYPSAKFLNESPLFLELLLTGTMHMSILKLDGEITSCIVCYHCKKWIHLAGMITYSPFFSKLSPGLVHIYKLGKVFKDSEFEFFDLTPGYDGYKDKFSTTTDTVYELTFSKNILTSFTKKKKVAFQRILVENKIRPMSFDLEIKRYKYFIVKKLVGFLKEIKNLLKPYESILNVEDLIFRKNTIKDLLNFEQDGMLTKWEFLQDCFNKTESGGEFFTITNQEKLVACIWLLPSSESKPDEAQIDSNKKPELVLTLEKSYFSKLVVKKKEELCKILFNKTIKSKK
jgi:hypothetical protein